MSKRDRPDRRTVTTALAAVALLLAMATTLGHRPVLPALSGDLTERWLLAALVSLAYLCFCGTVYLRHRRARREQEQAWAGVAASAPELAGDTAAPELLLAFASQTGFAEQLALQTAQNLRDGGVAVRVVPLGRVTDQELAAVTQALFVVSTTGEGDAPDGAATFARRMALAEPVAAAQMPALRQLRYGVLALGDRSYAHYCAFGHALESWLRRRHAQALFDTVEVDNGDEGALRHWQHHLAWLSGHEAADWSRPRYGRWRLVQRRLLNPGSLGGPVFHLALTPLDLPAPQWQAGDIVEIGPRNAAVEVAAFLQALAWSPAVLADAGELDVPAALAERQLPHDPASLARLRALTPPQLLQALAQLPQLPHREYSIASLPEDGTLDLLVRQMQRTDGQLGIGSGWLTQHAGQGGEIALRVRSNSGFHAPTEDIPLILIGNGTGLAGLRAHMHARARLARTRNWLVFGERTQTTDYFHRAEIEQWLADGRLQRLDLAFSRDQAEPVYVQDKLRAAADDLRRWVTEGAAIYVCGSLQGMASGVAAVLADVLGEAALLDLAEQGRYRRDVY